MNINIIYILIPLILGMGTSLICRPSSNDNNKISKYTFIIIWPLLYILIGLSWYNNISCSALFWLLNILLCSWLIVYSCINNKMAAFYILLLSLVNTIMCYTCVKDNLSKYYLSPLIVWLIVATIISYSNL